MELTNILWGVVLLETNAIAAILWAKLKKLESKEEGIADEIDSVKINYLNRFDALKDQLKAIELKVIERIAILEARIFVIGK